MKIRLDIALLLVAVAILSGCDQEARMSQQGFRLPDGDADAGRAAFLYMQCHQCHTIAGEQLPEIPGMDPPYVELGGKVSRVKTYGELITAIINPSHKLARGYAKEVVADNGESHMYIYNSHMTVHAGVNCRARARAGERPRSRSAICRRFTARGHNRRAVFDADGCPTRRGAIERVAQLHGSQRQFDKTIDQAAHAWQLPA
jgi:hypothetical protein